MHGRIRFRAIVVGMPRRTLRVAALCGVWLASIDCGRSPAALDPGITMDSGPMDAGSPSPGDGGGRVDAGSDAGPADGGPGDAGTPDSGAADAGPADAGIPDSGIPDSGLPDAGAADSGLADAGTLDSGPPARLASDSQDADRAVESLLLQFWKQSESSFDNGYPGAGTATGYWTFAEAVDAVLDGVEHTQGERFSGFMQTFYAAQDARGWSRPYFDDENWMALALIRAYDLSGQTDTASLTEAESLMSDIMTNAWNTSCCGSIPGGDWWDTAHTQKATASNAGPVITAVRLYQRTGNPGYLAFAQKVYDYWYANMVNPTTFQVADHFDPDGGKVWWKFTYNEGLMIGAAVELHTVTGTARYLQNARDIASFVRASEVTSSADGTILFDGDDSHCSGDCSQFKGIAHRYLTLLNSVSPNTATLALLTDDADAIWTLDRDLSHTIFATDSAGLLRRRRWSPPTAPRPWP